VGELLECKELPAALSFGVDGEVNLAVDTSEAMKQLVIFAGPPCTGKSAVGRALGHAHLEMDSARVRLLPESTHSREDRAIAYRAVIWTASHLLRYTDIVICNGGYGHEEDRAGYRAVAREAGASLYLVEFTAPLAVLIERNRKRRDHHPGLDLDDARVTEIVENYPWSRTGLLVDSTRPVTECAKEVRRYLQTPGMILE
jgi:predicted kinase